MDEQSGCENSDGNLSRYPINSTFSVKRGSLGRIRSGCKLFGSGLCGYFRTLGSDDIFHKPDLAPEFFTQLLCTYGG